MAKSPDALSWEDIRIANAVGVHGSVAAAALALGVNQSTIARRLSAIESALDVVLFDRRRTGYVPTAAGEEVIALSARIEDEVVDVTRRVSGRLQGHAGHLRVATSDILFRDYLAPIIADFQIANPEVRFEILIQNEHANLARSEADVAFRATPAPPENLFGRKIAGIAWAVYGARMAYGPEMLASEDLPGQRWISYGDNLRRLRAWAVVEEQVPPANVRQRVNSVIGVMTAIAAGAGIGYLPCMHGDLNPELIRVSAVDERPHDELWVLTHPDIRRSDRVYAFLSHCVDAILKFKPAIEGAGVAD